MGERARAVAEGALDVRLQPLDSVLVRYVEDPARRRERRMLLQAAWPGEEPRIEGAPRAMAEVLPGEGCRRRFGVG